jgi:hypothetical protein
LRLILQFSSIKSCQTKYTLYKRTVVGAKRSGETIPWFFRPEPRRVCQTRGFPSLFEILQILRKRDYSAAEPLSSAPSIRSRG